MFARFATNKKFMLMVAVNKYKNTKSKWNESTDSPNIGDSNDSMTMTMMKGEERHAHTHQLLKRFYRLKWHFSFHFTDYQDNIHTVIIYCIRTDNCLIYCQVCRGRHHAVVCFQYTTNAYTAFHRVYIRIVCNCYYWHFHCCSWRQ